MGTAKTLWGLLRTMETEGGILGTVMGHYGDILWTAIDIMGVE